MISLKNMKDYVKRYPHTIHAANFVGAKGQEARWGTATRSKEFLHMTKGTHTDMKARMGALKQSKCVQNLRAAAGRCDNQKQKGDNLRTAEKLLQNINVAADFQN